VGDNSRHPGADLLLGPSAARLQHGAQLCAAPRCAAWPSSGTVILGAGFTLAPPFKPPLIIISPVPLQDSESEDDFSIDSVSYGSFAPTFDIRHPGGPHDEIGSPHHRAEEMERSGRLPYAAYDGHVN